MSAPKVDVLAATTEESSAVPYGMTEVTRDEFWAAVRAEKRDVMPSPQRTHTNWMFNGTPNRWGWVSTGFASTWNAKPIYALARIGGAA